ncbi:MAG: alpha/beta hydrolase [Lachnospiraceae bacterium]|nr:alpha/beta hydrolase [Lachnospiraceae bacterium]
MEIRKELCLGGPDGGKLRECIFFTVKYNHFRDVSTSTTREVRDREEMAECECVLCLPESYTADGEETPLILSFHGAGSHVSASDDSVAGIVYVQQCIDAGYAALDVCGSEPHGTTMGCPEHIFAAYKAYRYAVKHYNLSEKVLVAGASMGGHVAMNFVNTFPSVVLAVGMFYPRLNMDGVTVNGHYCIGTWDKTNAKENEPSTRDRIVDIYRFKSREWSDETTIGFNPYRTRAFINAEGERVLIPPCPIKIWQGTADRAVDPVMVEEYVNSVRRSGSYIELHLMEDVGHVYSSEMCTELLYWFNRFI